MPKQLKEYLPEMQLRKNPNTTMHLRLLNRKVEHRDAFLVALYGGDYAVLIEHRSGGRGAPFSVWGFRVHRDGRAPRMVEPSHLKGNGLISGPYKPNGRERHPDADFIRDYHHKHLLKLLHQPPRHGHNHVNILCHYFYVADLDPTQGFANHWQQGYSRGVARTK